MAKTKKEEVVEKTTDETVETKGTTEDGKLKVKKKKPAPKKIPISKLTYKNVVEPTGGDNDLFYRIDEEERERQDGMYDYSWIIGVSERDDEFFTANIGKNLTGKKLERYERIMMKILDNMPRSLERDLKKSFKQWKIENKGKEFTQKEAEDSFYNYID